MTAVGARREQELTAMSGLWAKRKAVLQRLN